MSDPEHDYSKFADDETPGDNLLAQISVTAMEQLEAEAVVARLEEEFSVAKASLKDIAEVRLPELMEAARQEHIRTSDGLIVDMKEKIYATIPKKAQLLAFKWLEDNNLGDIIKRKFTIEFNKDEEDWAKKFEQELKDYERPLAVKREKSVHSGTLAKTIRELLDEGVPVPMGTLGAYRRKTTTVKNPTSD